METTLSKNKNLDESLLGRCRLWGLLGLLLLASCSSDDDPNLGGDPQSVQFSSTTSVATPQTRISGNKWDIGDEVGIYMLNNVTQSIANNAKNIEYKATTNGVSSSFTPVDANQTIYYPQDGSTVDFVAYYPYKSPLTSNIYPIDVSNQSKNIDFLYSNDATGKSKSSIPIAMTFNHRLTKLTIKVKAGTDITTTDLANLGIMIKGMPTTADLDLLNNSLSNESVGNISPKVETADEKYSAILIPQNKKSGSNTSFAVANIGTFDWDMSAINFEHGKHYTYEITISKTGISISTGTITKWNIGTPEQGEITMPVIETVLIKAGSFQMGSPDSDSQAADNEKPRHWVKLTQDYRMSKYQITNAQYAAFLNAVGVGSDGKYQTANDGEQVLISTSSGPSPLGLQWDTDKWLPQTGYANHPVIYVSWYGATEFATWLGGSLPTEAQWEYACRAGTETIYSFGDAIDKDYVNYGHGNKTLPVGSLKSNPLGLYDMHGNVFEWCQDQWDGSKNYPSAATENEAGENPLSTAGNFRVLRGGSWYSNAQFCRSAFRDYDLPEYRYGNVGFRVVLSL